MLVTFRFVVFNGEIVFLEQGVYLCLHVAGSLDENHGTSEWEALVQAPDL